MNKDITINKEAIKTTLEEYLIPVAAIVLVIIGTFFLIIPKTGQIQEVRSKIKQQDTKISQLSQKAAELSSLSETELYESSSLLLAAVPAEKDFYETLMMSKQIVSENGVFIESFKFAPGEVSTESAKKVTLSSLPFEISFNSNFENLKSMVENIEKMLPLVTIDRIRFGSVEATESGSLADFSGKINLMSYFSPLPKSLGAPEKPLPKIGNQDRELVEKLKSYKKYEPLAVEEEEVITVGKENPFPF
ncbi:type 4a pilus biogenesis protein PilO [Patescibacteria group bacterium]|nr:type 4a pilus biogenesis protein PilO [Patescibacteria group bacterium]